MPIPSYPEGRCRWCGARTGRLPPALRVPCRGRLAGQCERWLPCMRPWPQSLELDEYVDEQTLDVRTRRPPNVRTR